MQHGAYGTKIARHFGLSDAPALTVTTGSHVKIAVTRIRSAIPLDGESIAPPREGAYSLALYLQDSSDQELWLRGQRVYQGGHKAGGVSVVDLDDEPVARIGNGFDFLQFYIPKSSIDEVAVEHGSPPVRELLWDRGAADPTIAAFGTMLLPLLASQASNALFVDHVMLALRIHVAQRYGGLCVARLRASGGLAAWQERRAKELMRTHFANALSIADVARECGLSPNHFTRAFRQTTGVQPHRWLSEVRIGTAKRLLLQTDLPLVEIALSCGFGDQSYFTRMFTRAVGASPGAWRRSCRS